MENAKEITSSTLLPLGLVMSVATLIFSLGGLYVKVNINTSDISSNTAIIHELPQRTEFEFLKEDLDEIKNDIKILLTQ